MINQSLRRYVGDQEQYKVGIIVVVTTALLALILAQFGVAMAMGAILGGAVAALIILKPETTTLVVIFALYANLPVVAIRNGVPSFIATSFFLLLGVPFVHYILVRRQPIVITLPFILMIAYLGLILISAAFSSNVINSASRITDYVQALLLYFLVVNTLRTPDAIRKTIWVLLLAGGMVGSLSLYHGITHNYKNDFGGLAQSSDNQMGVADADFLGNRDTVQRLAGNVGEQNRYAQIMLVLVPLAMSRVWAERSFALRVLAVILGGLIMSGVLLSYSRGAGVAMMLMFLAMGLLRVVKFRDFIAIGVSGFIAMNIFAPGYLYRLSSITGISQVGVVASDQVDGSFLGRATENLTALRIFLEHPVLGVGPGQTSLYTRVLANQLGLRQIETTRRAHNMYLEELADTGVIGFAGFMAVVLLSMYQLQRARNKFKGVDAEAYFTTSALLLSIIAYLGTAVFLHLSYVRYYWFLLAMAAIAVDVFQTPKAQDEELSARGSSSDG